MNNQRITLRRHETCVLKNTDTHFFQEPGKPFFRDFVAIPRPVHPLRISQKRVTAICEQPSTTHCTPRHGPSQTQLTYSFGRTLSEYLTHFPICLDYYYSSQLINASLLPLYSHSSLVFIQVNIKIYCVGLLKESNASAVYTHTCDISFIDEFCVYA